MTSQIENENPVPIRQELIDEALRLYELGNVTGCNEMMKSLTHEKSVFF